MRLRYLVIIKYYFNYLILLLIFKNIHYILPINFAELNNYFYVFIPISYLVVKYMFIYDLDKNNYYRKDFLWPVIIGYSILNFIFKMHLFYDIFIILFLLILKDNNDFDIRIDCYKKNNDNKK